MSKLNSLAIIVAFAMLAIGIWAYSSDQKSKAEQHAKFIASCQDDPYESRTVEMKSLHDKAVENLKLAIRNARIADILGYLVLFAPWAVLGLMGIVKTRTAFNQDFGTEVDG